MLPIVYILSHLVMFAGLHSSFSFLFVGVLLRSEQVTTNLYISCGIKQKQGPTQQNVDFKALWVLKNSLLNIVREAYVITA